jgi:N-acetylneuraminic acid mutarotase
MVAVWTGHELLVWGGNGMSSATGFGDGGRYDPASDTWRPISTRGSPSPRVEPAVAWTGKELIVWGGIGCETTDDFCADGDRYDPALDRWSPMSLHGSPQATNAVGVWTGHDFVVWGGDGGGPPTYTLHQGARYDPVTDTWSPVASPPIPVTSDRSWVSTGSQMIGWGGVGCGGDGYCRAGAVYDPVANAWSALPTSGGPGPRAGHQQVWTDDGLLLWGGGNSGVIGEGLYRLTLQPSPTWRRLGDAPPGEGQRGASVVAAGDRVLIWGGEVESNVSCMDEKITFVAQGLAIDATTGVVTPMGPAGASCSYDSEIFDACPGDWPEGEP